MYDDYKLEDIYRSILLDNLEENYKELVPYKKIFEYVFEKVFLFDEIKNDYRHNDKNKYRESCRYIKMLIKICNGFDKRLIDMMDETLFKQINYINAPYDKSSLYYLNTIVNPLGMAKENYQIYLMCFRTNFKYSYTFFTNFYREHVTDFNGYSKFVRFFTYIFEYNPNHNMKLHFSRYYGSYYAYFISYFYANKFPEKRMEKILDELTNNFDYYYDLISMNIKNISNSVYYYIESLIQEIENKENNKDNGKIIIK